MEQLIIVSIFAAIVVAITWAGCALIACLHPQLHKGVRRAPFSALMTCAVTLALGATWHGCEAWDILLCPPVGAVLFGVLGATLPVRPWWNLAFVAFRVALPLAALVIGPHLPVTTGACAI